MAAIELLSGPDALRAHLETMEEPELMAQQISQQGAIHVLTFLLTEGCTPALASAILTSLNTNMAMVNDIAQRKGYRQLFTEQDATGGGNALMRTDRAIEAFAALCGIVGTLLLAARGPHAGWGFVLFLGSNAGWLVFSWRRHWYLFAQQVAFTGTSLFGIWRWLL